MLVNNYCLTDRLIRVRTTDMLVLFSMYIINELC